MAFCTNCGNQVEGGGFCNNCGNTVAADIVQPPPQPMAPPPPPPPQYKAQQPPPPQYQVQQPPPQYPQQPQYQQQQYAPQPAAQPNPIIADGIKIIKSFLSPDPTVAIKTAVASKVHAWAVVGGVSILLSALAITFLPGGFMAYMANAAMRELGGLLGASMRVSVGDVNRELPLGSFFGYGLLGSAIMYFAWALCIKAVYAISKVNAPFPMVLNMTAVTLLPSAVACAAAIILGFIWAPLAIILVAIGSVGNLLLLYYGTSNAIALQRNPLWLFLGAYVVCAIVLAIVVSQMFGSVLEAAMGGLGSGFGW